MTCDFCYDHQVVRATGHNGELVPARCPECGSKDIDLVRVCPHDPDARCTVPESIPCERIECPVLNKGLCLLCDKKVYTDASLFCWKHAFQFLFLAIGAIIGIVPFWLVMND